MTRAHAKDTVGDHPLGDIGPRRINKNANPLVSDSAKFYKLATNKYADNDYEEKFDDKYYKEI